MEVFISPTKGLHLGLLRPGLAGLEVIYAPVIAKGLEMNVLSKKSVEIGKVREEPSLEKHLYFEGQMKERRE